MAQTASQEVEAGILNAIAAAIQAASPTIEEFILSGEADLKVGLVDLFKNIPAVKGVLGLAVGPIEAAVEAGIETYVNSLFAKYTPAQIVAAVVALIQAKAAAL